MVAKHLAALHFARAAVDVDPGDSSEMPGGITIQIYPNAAGSKTMMTASTDKGTVEQNLNGNAHMP